MGKYVLEYFDKYHRKYIEVERADALLWLWDRIGPLLDERKPVWRIVDTTDNRLVLKVTSSIEKRA